MTKTVRWAVVGLLVLLAGGLFAWATRAQSGLSPSDAGPLLAECAARQDGPECSRVVWESVDLSDSGPALEVAAGILRSSADSDCHSLLHSLGQGAALARGADALAPGGSACEGGFYHGVLLQLGLEAVDLGRCAGLPDADAKACWHGVGHALVNEEGFSPGRAQQVCSTAANATWADLCAQGASMEFVFVAWAGGDLDRALSDTLDMCAEMGGDFAQGCVIQAYNQVATHDPVMVSEKCASATGETRYRCFEAVGAALGGAFQPASKAADLAVRLCGDERQCLDAAVRVALSDRPATGIDVALCAADSGLPSCRSESTAG